MDETMKPESVRDTVRQHYAATAAAGGGCGCGSGGAGGCCGSNGAGGGATASIATVIGYRTDELGALPEGADLGLGCGNPMRFAEIAPGETVLDLGSGGGIDCFLAARLVGSEGRVIGVDMTPEMLGRARENARRGGYAQVEFRLGEIEALPVADASVDVIISNCVINLSPEKPRVFAEMFRVLKPGGRIAVSDVIAKRRIPDAMRADPELLAGCLSGAEEPSLIEEMLRAAGFTQIRIETPEHDRYADAADPSGAVGSWVTSAMINARKPIAP